MVNTRRSPLVKNMALMKRLGNNFSKLERIPLRFFFYQKLIKSYDVKI